MTAARRRGLSNELNKYGTVNDLQLWFPKGRKAFNLLALNIKGKGAHHCFRHFLKGQAKATKLEKQADINRGLAKCGICKGKYGKASGLAQGAKFLGKHAKKALKFVGKHAKKAAKFVGKHAKKAAKAAAKFFKGKPHRRRLIGGPRRRRSKPLFSAHRRRLIGGPRRRRSKPLFGGARRRNPRRRRSIRRRRRGRIFG